MSLHRRKWSPHAGARFFAVDPLAPKYPHNSPYAFSENMVVDGVELEGLEVSVMNDDMLGTDQLVNGVNGDLPRCRTISVSVSCEQI